MPRGIPKNPEKAAASRKAANEAKKTGGKTTQKKRKTKGGDDATTWGAAANMALLVAVANKVMPEAGLTDKQWSEVVAAMGEEFAGTKSTAAQQQWHKKLKGGFVIKDAMDELKFKYPTPKKVKDAEDEDPPAEDEGIPEHE